MGKTIRKSEEVLTTTKEMVMNFYNAAKKSGDQVTLDILNGLFGEANLRPKNITERIKTFNDAYDELGKEHPYVRAYDSFYYFTEDVKRDKDLMAFVKLRIIVAALNEGWEPKFIRGEYRWYPLFYLYTEREIDRYKDKGEGDFFKDGGLLFGGSAYSGALAGLVYTHSLYAPSNAHASVGSRLCLKSEALSTYCGRQFASLWADFYCGMPQEKPSL